MQIKNDIMTLEAVYKEFEEIGIVELLNGSSEAKLDIPALLNTLFIKKKLRAILQIILVDPKLADTISVEEAGAVLSDFFLLIINVFLNVQFSLTQSILNRQKEMTEAMK